MLLLQVLFLLNIAEVFGGIAVKPSNTVVGVREKLFLECRTNNESKVRKWTHVNTSGSTQNVYKHPDAFNPSFRHFNTQVNADGSGSLYANSTRSEDAGIYGCEATVDGKDETFTAQVIVMESSPQCATNLTFNSTDTLLDRAFVWMECSVSFRGFWTPTVEWRQHSRDGNAIRRLTERDGVELVAIADSKVSSTLTFAISSSANGSFFSSRFYFTRDNAKDQVTATNIPTYSYNWSSDVIILPTYAVLEPTVNAFQLNASLSPIAIATDNKSSHDWYVISLSALSLFLVLVVIVAIAFCIHYKRRVSAKYATMAATSVKLDSPISDTYEIPPYAVEGNYETIDETEIGNDSTDQQILNTYPTPAAGYSALLPTTTPTTPPVYSRVQIDDGSPFNAQDNRSTMQYFGGKAEEAIVYANRTEEGQDPLRYLEIIGTASERNSPDEDIAKPSLMPVAADTERMLVSADNR